MKKLLVAVILALVVLGGAGCSNPEEPGNEWDMNMYAVEEPAGSWYIYWDAPEFDIYEAQNVYIQFGEYGSGTDPYYIDGVAAQDIIDTGSIFLTPDFEVEANWYLMHAEYNGWVYEELLDF